MTKLNQNNSGKYTDQVILCFGRDSDLKNSLKNLSEKWQSRRRDPRNNKSFLVGDFFEIDNNKRQLKCKKRIDKIKMKDSTRLYLLGHSFFADNSHTGDDEQKYHFNHVADVLESLLDLSFLTSPLIINLVICNAAYSQSGKDSFAQQLSQLLFVKAVKHIIIARYSIVLINEQGRKFTLRQSVLRQYQDKANTLVKLKNYNSMSSWFQRKWKIQRLINQINTLTHDLNNYERSIKFRVTTVAHDKITKKKKNSVYVRNSQTLMEKVTRNRNDSKDEIERAVFYVKFHSRL